MTRQLLIWLIFLIFCFVRNTNGQTLKEKTFITFISKKDLAKKISTSIPLAATIKTNNKIRKDVLIVNANDSIITVLKFVLDRTDSITNESIAIVNKYWTEVSKIENNEQLSKEEKKEKISRLYPLVYFDTIQYKVSDIEKILFPKDTFSKFAYYSCLSLYCVSGMAVIIGMVGQFNDSANQRTASERQIFGAVGLAGLAGCAANLIWLRHILVQHIYVRKWYFKIEARII